MRKKLHCFFAFISFCGQTSHVTRSPFSLFCFQTVAEIRGHPEDLIVLSQQSSGEGGRPSHTDGRITSLQVANRWASFSPQTDVVTAAPQPSSSPGIVAQTERLTQRLLPPPFLNSTGPPRCRPSSTTWPAPASSSAASSSCRSSSCPSKPCRRVGGGEGVCGGMHVSDQRVVSP